MERQPYVRYQITADISERGIGFSLKRAITDYIHHHKLDGKVSEFKATSDGFEGILELYPGSSMDVNMTALIQHLRTSGRMPSNVRLKPDNIKITPIPLSSTEPKYSDSDKIKSLEDAIRSLNQEKGALAEDLEKERNDAEIAREEAKIARMLYEDLEEKLRGSEKVKASAASGLVSIVEESPTIDSTKDVLDKNTEAYRKAQIGIIGGLFKGVADEIDKRRFYGTEEGVKEAKKTIEARDTYLRTYGASALNGLPQAAREAAERSWKEAEEIIKKHNKELGSVQPIKLPVHVAESGATMYFSIPLLQNGNGDVTRVLGEELNSFRKRISGDNVRSNTEQSDYMFSMRLQVQNGRNDAVKDSLSRGLSETLAGAKITPVFVYTEFVPGMPESKIRIEETQEQTAVIPVSGSVGDKILQRIRELGFEGINDFADKNGLSRWTLARAIEGKFTRGPNARTIGPFSRALSWTEEEYKGLFE